MTDASTTTGHVANPVSAPHVSAKAHHPASPDDVCIPIHPQNVHYISFLVLGRNSSPFVYCVDVNPFPLFWFELFCFVLYPALGYSGLVCFGLVWSLLFWVF